MLKYIIKRILITIPVLIGVTFIIFGMMYLTPGDPARSLLSDMATDEEIYALREEMGLNDPFLVRYGRYMTDLVRGDLGTSYADKQPVVDILKARLPVSIKLTFFCILFSVCIGITAGIVSAIRQYSFLDKFVTVGALFGISMPSFWLALMLILVFAVKLGLFPATGLYGPLYYILPVVSISAAPIATIARMTRSSMLEVVRQDYIRTARAKGQNELAIIMKHSLKNALIPVITVIGIQFANTLSGAVVNEQVFAIPGIGKMMVDAIKARNYPLVQGGVLVIAFMFCFLNLFVDLLYAFVDPRIRSQYVKKKEPVVKAEEE